MAECIKCGLKVSWVDYPQDTCSSCRSAELTKKIATLREARRKE